MLCLAPAGLQAHEGGPETVSEHIEEDLVDQTPAEEREDQRHTDKVTASDARAAALAIPDDPAGFGSWGGVLDWPVVAIHSALLINGKVLAYDSNGDAPGSDQTFTRAMIWDPETLSITRVDADTGVNIFCSGLAHLANGTLFLAGGNRNNRAPFPDGITATHTFDETTNDWVREGEMATERWYPSVTPLNDGEMLITEGDSYAPMDEHIPEVRETDGTFRELTGAKQYLPLYPWIDVAPDGSALVTGPDRLMQSFDPAGTGSVAQEGQRDGEYRDYGGHALYDIGKIMIAGGGFEQDPGDGGPDTTSASAVVVDMGDGDPSVSDTESMEFRRRQHNLTVLADGTVLATGGYSSAEPLVDLDNGVYNAELWDPADGGHWTTLAAMEKTRQYHSTALLLPDGRVLSAGGGVCGTCVEKNYIEKNAEVFSPPYLFKDDGTGELAPRPQIGRAPKVVGYDAPLPIRSPDADSIDKVALIRVSAVTHSVNMEQRYVPLVTSKSGTTITATSPENANIAPPGVYMLFVVDEDGVPSESKMVRLALDGPALPAAPTGLSTVPSSPANETNPVVKGTAPGDSTVDVYDTDDCSGTPLESGSASQFGNAGITVAVLANQATELRATATDLVGNTSDCSNAVTYVEDSSAPDEPTITSTDPDSPADDDTPDVKGTTEAGSTVTIHSGVDCSGAPLGSGTRAEFSSGITVTVPVNETTDLRALATDPAGNESTCSDPFAYTEDSAAEVPKITTTEPNSPANDDTPQVRGTTEAGSTVRIYRGASCDGALVGSGTQAEFSSGITVTVPRNVTTNLTATATDSVGNVSHCASPFTYEEDSSPPAAPSLTGSAPLSPANHNSPSVNGEAEVGSTVRIYSDDTCTGPVLATQGASSLNSAGMRVNVEDDSTTNLSATATDSAMNVSPCSKALAYTEDSTAPDTTAAISTEDTTATATFGSEPNASFECSLDGASFAGCSSPRAYGDLRPGSHRFEVRATDTSGNTDPTPAGASFTIAAPQDDDPADETPPITRIERKPARRVTNRMARFRFSSNEPGSRFRCSIDGRSKPCADRFSARMKRGRHVLEVAAIDPAGNVDPTSATHSWRVVKRIKRSKRSRVSDGLLTVGSRLAA